MKKIFSLLLVITSAGACKIDNYNMPDLVITGKIVDAQTNDLVPSGGSNAGTILRFYQDQSPQSLLFNTFPDGTFLQSRVFAGSYTYTVEGPFASPAAADITVNGNTELAIKVVPNVRLKATVTTNSGNSATVKVEYQKVNAAQDLVHLGLGWSLYPDPNVQTYAGGGLKLDNVLSQNLTSGEKIFVIENLQPGKKYYLRATARTNNPGNYYNYSAQLELNQ